MYMHSHVDLIWSDSTFKLFCISCLDEASEAVIQVDPGGVAAEADVANLHLRPPEVKKTNIARINYSNLGLETMVGIIDDAQVL
jgi:hypothetical protein